MEKSSYTILEKINYKKELTVWQIRNLLDGIKTEKGITRALEICLLCDKTKKYKDINRSIKDAENVRFFLIL